MAKTSIQIRSLPSMERLLERPESLPGHVARFFLPEPLETDELLVGRKAEIEQLDDAVGGWADGNATSAILVGPQGSGKTSLINCFLRRQSHAQKVIRRGLDERLRTETNVRAFFCGLFQIDGTGQDVETLIEQLIQAESRMVVLEGVHNLLLRVVGGRKFAELFFYILMRTRQRHCWLLSCRRLPWDNMDWLFGASHYFSHVIPVDTLSQDNLREALAARLEKCGVEAKFRDSKPEPGQEGRDETGEQKENVNAFYRAVLANSGGNACAALYFLLLCSRFEKKPRSLLLWPPGELDMTFLPKMDRFHLLSLAEISGHGALSVREHSQIFRTTGIQSKLALQYLEQLNLITPGLGASDGAEKTYDVSPVIHHSVTSALEHLNLLY